MDREALLLAIAAAPDADEPRLVLADLLTAEGDPWGELISVQCRLRRTPSEDLTSAVRRRHFPWAEQIIWRRGFPERIDVDRPEILVDHVDELRRLPERPRLYRYSCVLQFSPDWTLYATMVRGTENRGGSGTGPSASDDDDIHDLREIKLWRVADRELLFRRTVEASWDDLDFTPDSRELRGLIGWPRRATTLWKG